MDISLVSERSLKQKFRETTISGLTFNHFIVNIDIPTITTQR